LQHHGLPVCYGDIEDPEFIATLPLTRVKWIVSTAHERQINLALLQGLGHHGFAGRVAVTAHSHEDGEVLRRAGADLVLLPFADAAREAVDRLLRAGTQAERAADRF
jgi:Trk K+ transport system NAD-binding subunit